MKPNLHLKYERERRGWSQARVADEIGTTEKNVGRWERGVSYPYPFFREKLCTLFGKSAQELGFVKDVPGLSTNDIVVQDAPLPSVLDDPTIPPLPNEGRELVGRLELLDLLAEQLCGGKYVVLSGLPGVGKTAITVNLLQHPKVRATFYDGVLWAGLGPHPNVLEQLSRWGTLLGLPGLEAAENSLEARAIALHAAIGKRRMVLVVDDAWEIGSALPFKVGGPNCAFLITTRFPGVAAGIARNGVYTVPELNEDDGLELLSQLAPEVVLLDVHAAQTLVQEVGGLPLALTLLGKYLHTQAHSGQPRRLQAALARLRDTSQRLLVSGPLAPLERSPSLATGTLLSLQSVIAASDMQLDEQTRATFYALSVFPARPNSFSEEAALMVAQTSGETLDMLCDAGLLESSGPGRYSLHQTIADYASTHLSETLARERLVAYCIPFIESHCADYEILERESRNLLAGLKYAFESGLYAQLVRGVNGFAPFLLVHGLYDLALLHLQRAYQVSIWSGDTQALTSVLLNLGRAMYQQGEHNQAEVHLREGLSLVHEGTYREQTCQLLTLLSRVALEQDDLPKVEVYSQKGLLLARELANDQSIGDLLMNLAYVAGVREEGERAETFLQEALTLAEQSGSPLMISRVLSEWGELKLRQQQLDAAQVYFLQALDQIGQDEPEQIAEVQLGLARLALARGDIEETYRLAYAGLSLSKTSSQHMVHTIENWLARLSSSFQTAYESQIQALRDQLRDDSSEGDLD